MATTTSPTHRRATCAGPRATWGAPSACGTTGAAQVSGTRSSAIGGALHIQTLFLYPLIPFLLFSPPFQPRPGSPWRRITRRRTTCESFPRREAAAGRQGHYVYTVQSIYLIFIKIKRSLFISVCYADAEGRLLAVPAHIPCAAPGIRGAPALPHPPITCPWTAAPGLFIFGLNSWYSADVSGQDLGVE